MKKKKSHTQKKFISWFKGKSLHINNYLSKGKTKQAGKQNKQED